MSDDLRLPWRRLSPNYVVDADGAVVTAESILRLADAVHASEASARVLEDALRPLLGNHSVDADGEFVWVPCGAPATARRVLTEHGYVPPDDSHAALVQVRILVGAAVEELAPFAQRLNFHAGFTGALQNIRRALAGGGE